MAPAGSGKKGRRLASGGGAGDQRHREDVLADAEAARFQALQDKLGARLAHFVEFVNAPEEHTVPVTITERAQRVPA